jgi:uncharacterized protein YdeI (YjbR/CyaY-like superfamily)
MDKKRDLPVVEFASRRALETWLAQRGEGAAGIWLKIAKKESGVASVTYAEALDAALCFGWIDGQKDKLDEQFWLQRFTPRLPRGKWSQRNCRRAEELIAAGEMQPGGMREIERAKADGRWEAAYAGQASAEVPDDLQQALDANDRARQFFATLDRANRYAILYRIHEAKRPATRAQRIAKFVAMLADGGKIHP